MTLETGIRGEQSVSVTAANTAKNHGQRHAGRVCHPGPGGPGRKDLLDERGPRL